MGTNYVRYVRANLFGVVALIFWVIEPFIVDRIKGLPLFLLLSVTFFASFIISAIQATRNNEWRKIFRQPLSLFLVGICGVWVSDMLYIYAARLAPIAYVEYIDYFWPPLFVLFACLTNQHTFSFKEFFAHIASMLGLLFLLDVDLGIIHSFADNYIGYGVALLGAMLWAWFLTYSKSKSEAPSSMVGIYGGVGAILSLICHFKFEPSTAVSYGDLGLAVVLGLTGFGLAYQFWDYGVKHGNIALLSQANYLSRLVGIICLYVFTGMQITSNLLVGGGLLLATFTLSNWSYVLGFYRKFKASKEIAPTLSPAPLDL